MKAFLLLLSLCFFPGSLVPLPAADMEWARATEPRDWKFPRDHGVHPDYKTEWWYFTGNLAAADGRRFGYQLTFFRQGLRLPEKNSLSRWALTRLYFVHFTLTDVRTGKFYYAEKLDRGAMGQVEMSTEGMDLRVGKWSISSDGPDRYRLRADNGNFALDLKVAAARPLTLQGNKGLSQKAPDPGNASFYYSYTRLDAAGTIRIGKEQIPVTGLSWFDHEFSTSSLASDQVGWDWFSIQLDQGEDLMLYQVRKNDGSKDPLSNGSWIHSNGVIRLKATDFSIETLSLWQSPVKGSYPASWKLTIPKLKAVLFVTPQVADQELRLAALSHFAYWEGSCRIEGTVNGQKVSGYGYTELTGYAAPIGLEMK